MLPREKIMRDGGATHLSDLELLIVLLGTGVSGKPVYILAEELLQKYSTLQNVVQASVKDLKKINGLGPAKIAHLITVYEIIKRITNTAQSITNRH